MTRLIFTSLIAWSTLLSSSLAGAANPQPTISIQSITAVGPDIGTVVYSSAGPTIFRVAPSDGAVSRQSGSGVRVTTANATTALVTLTCTGGQTSSSCLSKTDTVTITAAGTPTGMAGALTNFTVAVGPVPPPTFGAATGTTSITFTVGGIPQGGSGSFYVGMDFPVLAAGSTGNASSNYIVTIGKGGQATSSSGTAAVKVVRPMSLQQLTALSFGAVARPRSGSGAVTLDPSTGLVAVSGIGAGAFSVPQPGRASYTVSGEGGQTFSISAPPFDLANGASTITVTPSTYPSSVGQLGGNVGAGGSSTVYLGGSFPVSSTTPLGAYTGSLTITVQYN